MKPELSRELERIEIPGEHDARARTWAVVRSAFAARAPSRSRSLHVRPALALAIVLALFAAALSSPGMAVLDRIRKTVGIEHAAPALFSLPSGGKLLVRTDAGVWVVQRGGSKRFLGAYGDASWSPFGRFVVATRKDELAALEPEGDVHWKLARPATRLASWGGTRSDTRIAYVSRRALRMVAGDSTGDHRSCTRVAVTARPAWQPGSTRVLAVAAPSGSVGVYSVNGCHLLWHTGHEAPARKLEWSSDGRRLLVLAAPGLRVYDVRGRVVSEDDPSDATRDVDAAFVPGTHTVVGVRVHGSQSDVFALRTGRSVFHVAGELRQLVPSPDGRWLLVTWPSADQWIFVRANGRGIRAVSNISSQFDSPGFPQVRGWAP